MDITEFSRLNYSAGTINNLLKKAENSITLNEAKDAAITLIEAALININNDIQQLKLDVAALQAAEKNDTPDEPVVDPTDTPTDDPAEGSTSENESEEKDSSAEENENTTNPEPTEPEAGNTDSGEVNEPNEPSSESNEDLENSDTSKEV